MSIPTRLGPYLLNEKLGQGGMGAVYAAVHVETNLPAAVKVLAEGLSSHEGFRERFQVEIETLKKLQHPNIVSLFGYGEQDGYLFYAMELVEGKSLQALLEEGMRFEWQQVAEFGIQICGALKHAQDHGVIHRDLKPANLLLADSGEIMLSDFGIAKLFGAAQMTVDGGVIGTVHYMSPEQADGQRVTGRSDLYSLGAVLYTLLARRPPFVSDSPAKILHALKYDAPVPVSQLAPGIPDELERIIMQLLEKEPHKRIATPLAAANRLRAMLAALKDQPPDGDFFSQSLADAATLDGTPSQLGLEPLEDADDPTSLTRTIQGEDSGEFSVQFADDEATKSTVTRYTEVEATREGLEPTGDESTPAWITALVILVAVIGVGALIYHMTRPPTADALYAEIEAAASDGETLEEMEDEITDFLNRFPHDPRRSEVEEWKREIERERMQRQFERRARRISQVEKLEPIERAYLGILRLAPEDPETALQRADALLTLYEVDPPKDDKSKRCVELLKTQRDELARRLQSLRVSEMAALRARMEAIERIRERSPDQAQRMYESVITLYGEQDWAAPFVEQSRRALQGLKHEPEE